MGMNSQPDIVHVGAHFDGEPHLGDQITGVRSNNASANDPFAIALKD
jgi:hypothetical protein